MNLLSQISLLLNAYAIGVISPDSQLNIPTHVPQTNQLYHLDQFAKMRGAEFNNTGLEPTIHNYKLFLAAQVELDEQGSNPLHPVNSTEDNPDIANIDTQILSYLCAIDADYCAGGVSYPIK